MSLRLPSVRPLAVARPVRAASGRAGQVVTVVSACDRGRSATGRRPRLGNRRTTIPTGRSTARKARRAVPTRHLPAVGFDGALAVDPPVGPGEQFVVGVQHGRPPLPGPDHPLCHQPGPLLQARHPAPALEHEQDRPRPVRQRALQVGVAVRVGTRTEWTLPGHPHPFAPLASPIGVVPAASGRRDSSSRPAAPRAPDPLRRRVPAAASSNRRAPSRPSAARDSWNGTIVAFTWARCPTAAAIRSALRSCSSRRQPPVNPRRGSRIVTSVAPSAPLLRRSSSAARASRRSGHSMMSSGNRDNPSRLQSASRSRASFGSTAKWTTRS